MSLGLFRLPQVSKGFFRFLEVALGSIDWHRLFKGICFFCIGFFAELLWRFRRVVYVRFFTGL